MRFKTPRRQFPIERQSQIKRFIYAGYFQDTLFEEIKELQFVTAEAEVVQAIDLCVVLMNTGEVAEVMADPEMAYGKFIDFRITYQAPVTNNTKSRLSWGLINCSYFLVFIRFNGASPTCSTKSSSAI